MSLLDTLSDGVKFLTSTTKQVVDVASAAADAKFSWQSRALDNQIKIASLQNQKDQIQINRTISMANVDIAKAQANAAIKQAQSGGGFDLGLANLQTTLGNLQGAAGRSIGGTGSSLTTGEKLTIALTVIGLGIAYLQLKKRG